MEYFNQEIQGTKIYSQDIQMLTGQDAKGQ